MAGPLAHGQRVRAQALVAHLPPLGSVRAQDHAFEAHPVALHAGEPGDGRAAGALQNAQERAFRDNGVAGVGVQNRSERGERARVVRAGRDADGALTDGGKKIIFVEHAGGLVGEAEPSQAREGEQARVVLARLHLAQARLHVAAQQADSHVRPQALHLRAPAQRGGAHIRAVRQLGQRGRPGGDEHVAHVLPL